MSIDPFADITSYELEDLEEETARLESEDMSQMDANNDKSQAGGQADFRMNELLSAGVHSDVSPPSSLTVKSSGPSADGAQTGPKGVLNDYKSSQSNERIRRKFAEIQREREIQNKTNGKIVLVMNNNHQNITSHDNKNIPPDDDDEDDADLRDLQQSQIQRIQAFQASLPTFGNYERIYNKAEFATLVKEIHEGTWVVLHLYDNRNEGCIRLHFAMENIASQFDHVKFVRGRIMDLMPKFSKEGLPALLVYRSGDLKHSAIRICDTIGKAFSDVEVATLLQSLKILTIPTGLEEYGGGEGEHSEGKMKINFKKSTIHNNFVESDNEND